MSIDIELDTVTHDIKIVEGRISTVSGPARLLQALKIRLKTHLGEWPFDTDAGVAYVEKVLTKPANVPAAQSEIARVILQDPEITEILELVPALDPVDRHLTIDGRIDTIYGELPFSL